MSTYFKFLFFAALALLSLASCADKEVAPVAEVKPEEPRKIIAPPPPSPREPGSIWSEGSKWNELFSSTGGGRNVGDIIFIKPTDQFKALVSPKPDRVTQSASEYVNSAAHESNTIVVTVKQVQAPGVYSVAGDQIMKVRGRSSQVSLSGKLRERDIGTDDTAPSDAVFDMNLEVNGADAEAEKERSVASREKDKDKEKEPEKATEKRPEKTEGSERDAKNANASKS